MDDVLVTVGGIIPDDDIAALKRGRRRRASSGPARPSREVADFLRGNARPRAEVTGEARSAPRRWSTRRSPAIAGRWPGVLTAVENRTPAAEVALRRLYPMAGGAHLVGITGPPGSGKSTLVSALIAAVREAGRAVAVVAVDPSCPITGGALLGDRVRMQAYAERPRCLHPLDGRTRPCGRPRLDLDARPRRCSTRPAST